MIGREASYAPTSHPEAAFPSPSTERDWPRWSTTARHSAAPIQSIAALPGRSAIVCVEPPFHWSAPSFGSTPVRSFRAVPDRVQPVSVPYMFWFADTSVPSQSAPPPPAEFP
jgi:hypothetical protein